MEIKINFPDEEYEFLELLCNKENISYEEFINKSIVEAIEDYEDCLEMKKIDEEYKKKYPTCVVNGRVDFSKVPEEEFCSWEEL